MKNKLSGKHSLIDEAFCKYLDKNVELITVYKLAMIFRKTLEESNHRVTNPFELPMNNYKMKIGSDIHLRGSTDKELRYIERCDCRQERQNRP